MLELEANTLQHLENTQTTISAQLHRAVKSKIQPKADPTYKPGMKVVKVEDPIMRRPVQDL